MVIANAEQAAEIDNLGEELAGWLVDQIYYQAKEVMSSDDPNFMNLQEATVKHLKKLVAEIDD